MAESKKKTEEVKEAVEKNEVPKMVKIMVPRDRQRPDMTVGIGGKIWRIKRGVEVEVPKNVAILIKRSLEQDNKTFDMIESKRTD